MIAPPKMIRRYPFSLARAVVVAGAALGANAGVHAQLDARDEVWDEPRPVMPTPAEEMREFERFAENDRDRRMGGLMREGAHLMSVRGIIRRDADAPAWIARLTLDAPGGQVVERDMRLLPNSFLAEVQEIVRTTPDQRITFEITGEMFVYHRRNYLLLRAPARVAALEAISREDDVDAKPQADADADVDEMERTSPRSAADVMRELERESGPLHRPPAPAPGKEAVRDASRAATNGQRQWREGALLVQRRGRVTRDAGGAWMFVFDADAQGLADPPLTLMPSLLLERIERYARQAGPTAPILISGQVFAFEGRGYLLPSAFQLPRERTAMH